MKKTKIYKEFQFFSLKKGCICTIKLTEKDYQNMILEYDDLSENIKKKFENSLDNYINTILSYNC
ncbi:MAG: hypothetical protein J6S85_09275 [Methanobrevibacter sp.]|nr:hypothetical protein [Methanobrevibacter sp.]